MASPVAGQHWAGSALALLTLLLASPSTAAPSCPERTAAVVTWLSALDREGDSWTSVPLVRTDLPANEWRRAPEVAVDVNRVAVNGRAVDLRRPGRDGALPGLVGRFEELRREQPHIYTQATPGSPSTLLRVRLLVAPKVRARRVAAVISSLRGAGARRIDFVVTGRFAAAPPPTTPLTPTLARATTRAALWEHQRAVLGGCPATSAWPPLGNAPEDDVSRRLTEGLQADLPGCACTLDLDLLQAWVWATRGRFQSPALVTFSVALGEGRPAAREVLRVSGRAPWERFWSEVHARASANRPLWLRVSR